MQSDSWENGKLLLNEYLIEGEIGEGGMGKVYLARSRSADHQFAVKRTKVLRRGQPAKFPDRVAAMENFRIPAIWSPAGFSGRSGRKLRSSPNTSKKGDRWRIGSATGSDEPASDTDVAIQSAWGLQRLHEMELIHRDIKPANVLMTSDGLAKVTDFGLAAARVSAGEKPSDFGKSNFVSYGGRTPAYCSPEQADGRTLTRQSDIWSWAVSVLQMSSGRSLLGGWGQAANLALEEYSVESREIS